MRRRSVAGTSVETVEDWRLDAACAGHEPDVWFPTSLTSIEGRAQAADAKAICARCPARAACLADAMDIEASEPSSHRHGIRGGLLASERARLAKGEAS